MMAKYIHISMGNQMDKGHPYWEMDNECAHSSVLTHLYTTILSNVQMSVDFGIVSPKKCHHVCTIQRANQNTQSVQELHLAGSSCETMAFKMQLRYSKQRCNLPLMPKEGQAEYLRLSHMQGTPRESVYDNVKQDPSVRPGEKKRCAYPCEE